MKDHQPQQTLVLVKCNERLPQKTGHYHCLDKEESEWYYFNHTTERWYYSDYKLRLVFPSHWYEPTTRIVLMVEDYKELKRKADEHDAVVKRFNGLFNSIHKYPNP